MTVAGPRAVVAVSLLAAAVTFCVVQDRVTAAGARRYVTLQRAALAGAGPPVSVDAVMGSAINSSVHQGFAWGGGVLAVGLGAAAVAARRKGARPPRPTMR